MHKGLVLLYLSPSVSNSPLFELLKPTATDAETGETNGDSSFLHVDDDADFDPTEEPGRADVFTAETAAFINKYIYEHNRYPEESQDIRDLVAHWTPSCLDSNCPTRGLTGGGDRACKHTFPMEFRPPADLVKCHRKNCGETPLLLCFHVDSQVILSNSS